MKIDAARIEEVESQFESVWRYRISPDYDLVAWRQQIITKDAQRLNIFYSVAVFPHSKENYLQFKLIFDRLVYSDGVISPLPEDREAFE